jgi:hypothetical protein
MATTMQRTNRHATPARWQAALARAIAEGIQVRQLAGCGAWIATSGTDASAAYELAVVNGVAVGCECPAGEHGDPVCKHRAAFYHLAGQLDPEPPTPAAPALTLVPRYCPPCDGKGYLVKRSAIFGTTYRVTCQACGGKGIARKAAPAPLAA